MRQAALSPDKAGTLSKSIFINFSLTEAMSHCERLLVTGYLQAACVSPPEKVCTLLVRSRGDDIAVHHQVYCDVITNSIAQGLRVVLQSDATV